ncbi:MAG: hypothetical protein ABN488_00645, partial [Methylobacteriaceae bacterium]
DVAQPAAQARGAEQRRTAEAGRAVSAAAPAPVSAPAPVRNAAPAAGRSQPASAPVRPANPAAVPGQVQGRPGTRDNRGWLSDLLTRASLDDDGAEAVPAPAPAAAPEAKGPVERISLDAISTDIARMVDHQASVEFWQRYRQGDTNLFDGRLYTVQGRQTFEQIQRRYRADAEFRRTVDRYVGEFERLLGEVTKNDRDTKRADAYLTSETGKVYTMLAHASGRFDEA